MPEIKIAPLRASPETCAMLSELLIEVVAGGGSVSFMHPLARDAAADFWRSAFLSAERNERVILGAWDDDQLVGTVTLLIGLPANQPHRAEIGKMMTRQSHRGRGIASALLREAEATAIEHNRTLLMLDTASEDGASGLYERHGFTFAGEIPDFALKPHGGLTGTRFYWKRIGAAA